MEDSDGFNVWFVFVIYEVVQSGQVDVDVFIPFCERMTLRDNDNNLIIFKSKS